MRRMRFSRMSGRERVAKRILITGGFGYLGGRLAVDLASRGYIIRLSSRVHTGAPDWLPEAEVVQTDLLDPISLRHAVQSVDIVIHLAAMNAQACLENPKAAITSNIGGTQALVDAAVDAGVQRLVYFSTIHVYGNPLEGCITEETPTKAYHPYAMSHRAAEDIVCHAHMTGQIEGIVVRLSNAFGAPVDESASCWILLLNDLCKQAVKTQKMSLKTSGIQRRDFIPITELSGVITHLINLAPERLKRVIFNTGSGLPSSTVWDMALLIQARCRVVLNIHPTLTRTLSSHEENESLHYSIDKLCASGYQPRCDRFGEIDNLLTFCKQYFSDGAQICYG